MNKNDLVSRFREKTDKHWHPFMGVETKLEKRVVVPGLTEGESYRVHVNPQLRMETVEFIGHWPVDVQEFKFMSVINKLLYVYSPYWMKWDERETLSQGYYCFRWEKRELDIKGDG